MPQVAAKSHCLAIHKHLCTAMITRLIAIYTMSCACAPTAPLSSTNKPNQNHSAKNAKTDSSDKLTISFLKKYLIASEDPANNSPINTHLPMLRPITAYL